MNCQSRAYMIRERDGAGVVYRCYREWPHADRPHKNGIGSDAGAWSTRGGLRSLWYLAFARVRGLFGGAA